MGFDGQAVGWQWSFPDANNAWLRFNRIDSKLCVIIFYVSFCWHQWVTSLVFASKDTFEELKVVWFIIWVCIFIVALPFLLVLLTLVARVLPWRSQETLTCFDSLPDKSHHDCVESVEPPCIHLSDYNPVLYINWFVITVTPALVL